MKRYGSVIGVNEATLPEYKRLHAAVWPAILQIIADFHIRNYSIYVRKLPDGLHYLFSHFEYHGENFKADMEQLASFPVMKEWWSVCEPLQAPLADRTPGDWWATMEEVFFFEGGEDKGGYKEGK